MSKEMAYRKTIPRQQNGSARRLNKEMQKRYANWDSVTKKELECHKTKQKLYNGTLKQPNKNILKHNAS